MREIKFRAWDKHSNRMVFIQRIDWWDDGITQFLVPVGESDPLDCDKCTLMQFTGLHDKNGREIFEGDVVSFKQFGGHSIISVIRWNELRSAFDSEEGKIYLGYGMDCEVLGNIYEHPNLLEVK